MAQYNPTKAEQARSASSNAPTRKVPFFKKKDLKDGPKNNPGETCFRYLPLTEAVMFPDVSLGFTIKSGSSDKGAYRSCRKATSYGIYEYFERSMPQEWQAGVRPVTVADYLHDVMVTKAAKNPALREKVKFSNEQGGYSVKKVALFPVLELTPDSDGFFQMPQAVYEGDIKFLQLDGNLSDKFFAALTTPKNKAFTFGNGKAITVAKGKGNGGQMDVAYTVSPAVEDAADLPKELRSADFWLYQEVGTFLYEREAPIKDQFKNLCDYYGIPEVEREGLWNGFNEQPMAVTVYDDDTTTMDLVIEFINQECRDFITKSIAEDIGVVSQKPAPAKPSAKPVNKPAAPQTPAYASDELDMPQGQDADEEAGEEGTEDGEEAEDTPAPAAAKTAPAKPYNPEAAVAAAKPSGLRKPPRQVDYTQD